MSVRRGVAVVAVVLGLTVACRASIGTECDPTKRENGCDTKETGRVCVRTYYGVPDGGSPDDAEEQFFCEKPCETDDDCEDLFGCDKASCTPYSASGGAKFRGPLKSGTLDPCPRGF